MTAYKKTPKGMDELLAKGPSIDARVFGVLVLVDGSRDSVEINRLAKEAALPVDALEILLHGGFVEQKFRGSPTPFKPAPGEAGPSLKMSEQADATIRFRGFQDLYAYQVGQVKALLGLRGFVFQLRIEKASALENLQALIAPMSESIAKKHGFEIAQKFKRECELRMRIAVNERGYLKTQAERKQ